MGKWAYLLAVILLIALYAAAQIIAESQRVPIRKAIEPEEVIIANITHLVYPLTLKADGKGKNYIMLPERTSLKKASDVLRAIPHADAITYYNSSSKESIGYVNAFGGLGIDFEVRPGEIYEVSVIESTNFTLREFNNMFIPSYFIPTG
ncbi:MAG: hypothetical protein ABIB71_08705 [Candidatus Woesearchaeota archaeon]